MSKKLFWFIIATLLIVGLIGVIPADASGNEAPPQLCYRVVDDYAAFGHIREFSSAFTGTWYPAVFPFTTSPKSGDAAYKITPEWFYYTVSGAPDILRWMGGGWLNTSQNKNFGWRAGEYVPLSWNGEPSLKAEALTTTGNLVCGSEIVSGSLKVTHYSLSNSPQGDYFHQPWLWIKGTSLNKNNGDLGLWDGKNVYFPNLAAGDIYLDLDYLERVPPVPKTVMARARLNVRQYPTTAAQVMDVLNVYEYMTITTYHFYGSDVWGQIPEGWIKIVDCYSWACYYYTTWEMNTDPPLNEYPQPVQPLGDFTTAVITPTNTPAPTPVVTPIPGGDYEQGYIDGWNDALDAVIATAEAMKK